jgi:hypothetical protein
MTNTTYVETYSRNAMQKKNNGNQIEGSMTSRAGLKVKLDQKTSKDVSD